MTDCPHGTHYPTRDAALAANPEATAHACACGAGWLVADPHRAARREVVIWRRRFAGWVRWTRRSPK